jgi:isopentenyl-diphosphate delta-isomerase
MQYALKLPDFRNQLFEGIRFLPEALPELSEQDIDITTEFCGLTLQAPLLINAVTGGTRWGAKVNAQLAEVAKRTDIPLAVGSQRIALDNPRLESTFTIVRQVYPKGIIFANLGADCGADQARRAVEMIQAHGLQLHLNAAQELAMQEGDRSFYWQKAIETIVKQLTVPVIAKEVGCGMTGTTARRLLESGVAAVDIGGLGGTNFVLIEHKRRGCRWSPMVDWGLSTPKSLLSVLQCNPKADVCATGGIRSGVDMGKALACGARICGIAKPVLQAVVSGGIGAGVRLIHRYLAQLRSIMVLVGARDLSSLRKKPLIFDHDIWVYLQQQQSVVAWR